MTQQIYLTPLEIKIESRLNSPVAIADYIVDNYQCNPWTSDQDLPIIWGKQYCCSGKADYDTYLPFSDHLFDPFLDGLMGYSWSAPGRQIELARACWEYGKKIRTECEQRSMADTASATLYVAWAVMIITLIYGLFK